jgi:hypothetical protein
MRSFGPDRERELHCPNCGQLMRLTHNQPPHDGLPELRSYRCFVCNEVLTEAVENQTIGGAPGVGG